MASWREYFGVCYWTFIAVVKRSSHIVLLVCVCVCVRANLCFVLFAWWQYRYMSVLPFPRNIQPKQWQRECTTTENQNITFLIWFPCNLAMRNIKARVCFQFGISQFNFVNRTTSKMKVILIGQPQPSHCFVLTFSLCRWHKTFVKISTICCRNIPASANLLILQLMWFTVV